MRIENLQGYIVNYTEHVKKNANRKNVIKMWAHEAHCENWQLVNGTIWGWPVLQDPKKKKTTTNLSNV